jgi:tetratricopeptide (TPR) repeat protein
MIEYAQTALEAGYPGEAKRALDLGPAGTGDAALRARVTHDIDVDQKSLAKVQSDAEKASTGTVLVKLGVDYYGYGQYDKAISLIQEGIAKGGLKSPEDATLSLGIAYLAAGQKDKGVEALKQITQTGGPLEIAQIWIMTATVSGQ